MRTFFLLKQRRWRHITILFVCSIVPVLCSLLVDLTWPGLLDPIELWTVDLRFRLRPSLAVAQDPSQPRSDTLVTIDYDDQAAREYGLGRWPWDRRVHARVIDFLRKAGARVVLVDLLFAYPAQDPQEDSALVEATRRAGMVIYPVAFTTAPESESSETFHRTAPQHLDRAEVHGFGDLPGVGELTLPLTDLVKSAGGLGHIQWTIDRDGVVRRIQLVYSAQGGFVPALALTAALRHLQADPAAIRIDRGQAVRFKTPDKTVIIPIDTRGQAWINYAGPWGTRFLHYPYSWLLDQMATPRGRAMLPKLFQDKIVLVANLTVGSGDRVATPLDRDFPASEIHLHVLNMLLHQQFLRDGTWSESVLSMGIPILLLTGAAVAGGPWLIIPTFLVALGAYLMTLQIAFTVGGMVLPAAPAILALSLSLISLLAARFFIVDRERIQFQTVLNACLPPQTVRVIRENPKRLSSLLAGHTRELTILFADIEGFSGFCRRSDPCQIQQVLRDYLTAMTVIVRSYGGTLDKYIGDGCMAFFGDDGPEPNGEEAVEEQVTRQAANAVRAGLAMQRKMAELNAHWVRQGQEPHLIRIGINTGVVAVGNMGTEYLWDYTVIGSEVNKAQRLEKAAEPGGLLLSRRTYALARNQGVFPSELPTKVRRLRGIGKGVEIYVVSAAFVAQLSPDVSSL